jgi:hypothetical protein
MLHVAYLSHCIIWILACVCSYALDHAELEFEKPMERDQVEEFTNLALDQGKPQCIPPIICGFSFNHYLSVMLVCALSIKELCWYNSYIMVNLPNNP